MNGTSREADVRYTVGGDNGFQVSAICCREHFRQVLDTPSINVVSSEPVEQMAYLSLLRAALHVPFGTKNTLPQQGHR